VGASDFHRSLTKKVLSGGPGDSEASPSGSDGPPDKTSLDCAASRWAPLYADSITPRSRAPPRTVAYQPAPPPSRPRSPALQTRSRAPRDRRSTASGRPPDTAAKGFPRPPSRWSLPAHPRLRSPPCSRRNEDRSSLRQTRAEPDRFHRRPLRDQHQPARSASATRSTPPEAPGPDRRSVATAIPAGPPARPPGPTRSARPPSDRSPTVRRFARRGTDDPAPESDSDRPVVGAGSSRRSVRSGRGQSSSDNRHRPGPDLPIGRAPAGSGQGLQQSPRRPVVGAGPSRRSVRSRTGPL
jgi:hypothetical protein